MFTANPDDTDLFILDPHGKTSHFLWRDPRHVMAWAWHSSPGNRFYLFRDRTDHVEVVGKDVMNDNGHNTCVPCTGDAWVLNDTYPDKQRLQHLYLFHIPSHRRVPLGPFRSSPEYQGEWRCDLHPCASRDGKGVVFDSPHGGDGRQVCLVDISGIVGWRFLPVCPLPVGPFEGRTSAHGASREQRLEGVAGSLEVGLPGPAGARGPGDGLPSPGGGA